MAYRISGKTRKKIKISISALEYQDKKFGLTEAEKARLTDLKNSLNEKMK